MCNYSYRTSQLPEPRVPVWVSLPAAGAKKRPENRRFSSKIVKNRPFSGSGPKPEKSEKMTIFSLFFRYARPSAFSFRIFRKKSVFDKRFRGSKIDDFSGFLKIFRKKPEKSSIFDLRRPGVGAPVRGACSGQGYPHRHPRFWYLGGPPAQREYRFA